VQVVAHTPVTVQERSRAVSAFAYRNSTTAVPVVRNAGVDGGGALHPVAGPALSMDHMPTDEREGMRRRLRGLARVMGGPLELHDLSSDPAVDDQFLDLQSAGWKGDPERGGAALRLDPLRERWFRAVTSSFRRDGDLLALRLASGGSTLWIGYGLRSGGAYFGFIDAYAEEHARYSPGSIGRVALMTYVFGATDTPFFDPAFDARYSMAARLFPDRRTNVDLLLATSGLGARTVLRAVPVARRAGMLAP